MNYLKSKKTLLLMIIMLFSFVGSIFAADMEVKIVVGDTQVGQTFSRNVSKADLTSLPIKLYFKNNSTSDTIFRINILKTQFDLNQGISKTLDYKSWILNKNCLF